MKPFDLSGHTALVTGSNRGIGKALVLGLAKQSANVIVHCANNIDQAHIVAEQAEKRGVQAVALRADLSEASAPQQLYDQATRHFPNIDILVLNASAQIDKPWEDITHEDFALQMTVNVRASMELMQLFVPYMAQHGWGRILTVGSVQQVKPHPMTLVYAASKDAQMSMVRNLAKQYAAQGITVNNLAPGFIATDRNAEKMADAAYMEQVRDKIPSRTIGEPEDCVGAAILLCSDSGRYITGINLIADGGMHL
jgi:glucose 1-dehydrogenase